MLESRFKPRQGLNVTPTFSFHTSFILKDGWGAVSSKQVTVRQKEPVWVPKVSRLCSHPFLENVNQKGLSPPPKPHPHAHVGLSRLRSFQGLGALEPPAPTSRSHPMLLRAASYLPSASPSRAWHLTRWQSSVWDPPPVARSCARCPEQGLKQEAEPPNQ